MGLKKLLTVSNKVINFAFVSSFLMCISHFIFNNYYIDVMNGIQKLGLPSPDSAKVWNAVSIGLLSTFDTIIAVSYFFALVVLIVTILSFKLKQRGESEKNNKLTGSILFALSFVCLELLLFESAIYLFLIIPTLTFFFASITVTFILILILALLSKKEDMEESLNLSLWKRMDARFKKFGFPHYRQILIISFVLAIVGGGMVNRLYGQFTSISILNYISFAVGSAGILYFVLGRHYMIKRSDEFQRIIYLEQSNFVLNFLFVFIYGSLLLAAEFRIDISVSSVILYFSPVLFFSLLLAEGKYK